MEQQGYFVSRCDDGTRRILYSEDIEIFENWFEGTVEIIIGVPVVCVDGLIQMMLYLFWLRTNGKRSKVYGIMDDTFKGCTATLPTTKY